MVVYFLARKPSPNYIAFKTNLNLLGKHCAHKWLSWGPFVESPNNLSGPVSYFYARNVYIKDYNFAGSQS